MEGFHINVDLANGVRLRSGMRIDAIDNVPKCRRRGGKVNIRKAAVRRLVTVGRVPRMAVATVLVSAGLLAATGGVAHASIWQLNDGFDYQPANTWRFE